MSVDARAHLLFFFVSAMRSYKCLRVKLKIYAFACERLEVLFEKVFVYMHV